MANPRADLALFADDSFGFAYSSITLQHIPPEAAEAYAHEFFRVLKPDGVAVFQMPNGPRIEPGYLRWQVYNLRRRVFRRWCKRLRGRPACEMHWIVRSRMTEVVDEGNGELVDVQDLSGAGRVICATTRSSGWASRLAWWSFSSDCLARRPRFVPASVRWVRVQSPHGHAKAGR